MVSVRDEVNFHEYDVFLSLGGPDRLEVDRLTVALRDLGLRVFVDEDRIRHFTGISAEIEQALGNSRALVAYYSAAYPLRSACQFELTAAYLAGQREGDPGRRIIVVNPEDREDHIQPVELAEARFAARPKNQGQVEALARLIRDRVHGIDGVIGAVAFDDRPRWFGARVPGSVGFVGRYRELWTLHGALAAGDFPLTQAVPCGPVAALVGLPGSGRTALAAAYAWQFGAAFRGGVYWLDLAGADNSPPGLLARYADEVRAAAERAGLLTRGAGREQLFGTVADTMAARPDPSLWIVDNLPDEFDPRLIPSLLLPAGDRVRTILIAGRDLSRDVVPVVPLGPMSADDSRSLLRAYREPEGDAEEKALDRLADLLGRHPGALAQAGRHLRPRRGLLSFTDFATHLATAGPGADPYSDSIRRALGGLDATQSLVLRIASVCASAPIPAALLTRAVRLLGGDDLSGPDLLGRALADLEERLLATHEAGLWSIPPLVRIAGRDPSEDRAQLEQSAAAVADCVLLLLNRDPAGAQSVALASHAQALAERPALDRSRAVQLLRRVAEHYESRGEAAFAARYRDRVLAELPDSMADLLSAARDHHVAGAPARAVELALRAQMLADAGGASPALLLRINMIHAAALDALSRHAEADALWTRVAKTAITVALAPAQRLAARAAHVHALVVRSELRLARDEARELIREHSALADDAVDEELQAVRLELAWIQLMSDGPKEARRIADGIVEHYRSRGMPQHFRCLQAQEVFAEALLTPQFDEIRLDDTARAHAEKSLRDLWHAHQETYGAQSPLALAAAVGYGYALVSQGASQGRGDAACAHLTRLRPQLRVRCGERHPLYLRATYLLGLVHRQLSQHEKAVDLFRAAFDGQRAVLGPAHPHTLESEYEVAISCLLGQGSRDECKALLAEVRRLAPKSMGYANYLRSKADVMTPYAYLMPRWLISFLSRFI